MIQLDSVARRLIRVAAYMIKPKFTMGSIVIVKSGTRVLLVRQRHSTQTWGFPGGFVAHRETAHACAMRELREETGLQVDITDLHLLDTYVQASHRHIDNLFGVESSGPLLVQDRFEIVSAEWVEIDEISSRRLNSESQQALARVDLSPTTPFGAAPALLAERRIEHSTRRGLLSASALVLVIAACIIFITQISDWPPSTVHPLAIALLLSGLLLGTLYFAYSIRVYTAPYANERKKVDSSRSDVILEEASSIDLSAAEALAYYYYYCHPRAYIPRIGEAVSANARSLSLRSTFTLAAPPISRETTMPVPLLLIPKFEMPDGLRIESPGRGRISSVSQDFVTAFTIASTLTLIIAAISPESQNPPNTLDVDLAGDIVALLIEGQRAGILGASDRKRLISRIKSLPLPERDSEGRRYLEAAAEMVNLSADFTPICVSIGDVAASGDRITVQRRVIPQLLHARRIGAKRVIDWIRYSFGVRSNVISVPVANAARCANYHLQVVGPDGSYLARQGIVHWGGSAAPMPSDSYSLRSRHGQRHSHLYLYHSRPVPDLLFENHFFERTPGSVGVAAVISVSAAITVALAAAVKIGLGQLANTDVVAMLLALPTAVAAWSGFDESRALPGGTLLSRVTSISACIVSIIAICGYVLIPTVEWQDPHFAERFQVKFWISMAITAALIASVTLLSWWLRALVQRKFLKK